MSLVPFDSVKSCPKCGHEQMSRHYCTGGMRCIASAQFQGDHHDRECFSCGYKFAEATKDHGKKQVSETIKRMKEKL